MAMFKKFHDIEIPPFLMVEGWDDASWQNDACPKVIRKLDLAQTDQYPMLLVWVNWDDPGMREMPGSAKYCVEAVDSPEDDDKMNHRVLFEGEDAIGAQLAINLAVKQTAVAKAPKTAKNGLEPYGRDELITDIAMSLPATTDAKFIQNKTLRVKLRPGIVAKIDVFSPNRARYNSVRIKLFCAHGEFEEEFFEFKQYLSTPEWHPMELCIYQQGGLSSEDWYGNKPASVMPLLSAIQKYLLWWSTYGF